MNNSGDFRNHPFSPSCKNNWFRNKKHPLKKPNIFCCERHFENHIEIHFMLTVIFNLNQRQRRGTNKTQKLTRKATGYCKLVLNKQCGSCTNIFKLQPWLIGKQQMTTAAVWLPLVPEWKTSLELITTELNCWDQN